MASIAPARTAAFKALVEVERGTAHSDDALHSGLLEPLSKRDRDLATELTLGTLRWELVLDDQIAQRLRDPSADMHLGVIVALRLGAYQLLMLDRIPPHAAIGESVELAKSADGAGAASLTNAILRRIARETAVSKPRFSPVDAHPAWLLRRWQQQYGANVAADICAYDQAPAQACIRLLSAQAEDLLAQAGAELLPGEFLQNARLLTGGDAQPLLASGSVRLQDEASQLVGELAALCATQAEQRAEQPCVLDCCAAPGGKTAVLLERTHTAQVTAMDVSERRLRALASRIKHPRLTVTAQDARMLERNCYDVILCDVPCSGTGTLARNPEIRTRLSASDLLTQAERQQAILTAALGALRPGGTLVYSTCSLEHEENQAVMEAVMRNSDGYELLPIGALIPSLLERGILSDQGAQHLRETAVQGPFLRTIPGVHRTDGFFAAVLQRPA